MAIVKTDSQYYSDIADAIRSKLGGSDSYYPSGMANAIMQIPSSGAYGDPNLVDIFNHGTVIGLNPILASYDPINDNFSGFSDPDQGSGYSDRYFRLMDNGTYLSRHNMRVSDDHTKYVVLMYPLLNKCFTKIKVDCEVVNGIQSNSNQAALGIVYWESPFIPSNTISEEINTDNFSVTQQTVYLVHPTQGDYNMARSVIEINVPLYGFRYYSLVLMNTYNDLNIYSIWLEP